MNRKPLDLWPLVCRLASAGDWPPQTPAATSAFFEYANRQGLLPLLMADPGVPEPVAMAKAGFRALAALYRKRYELSRIATLEMVRVLGSETFLFYKGADYRHRLYALPELRPMTDVDVYVPASGIKAALERLESAGYRRKYVAYGAHLAPGFYDLSFEIKGVHVEMHRAFAQPVRARIDYAGIWRRRELFHADGIVGLRLAPADALLVQAYSLAKDEFSSELNRYLDFYMLLQQPAIDLRDCVRSAKAWEIQRPLFSALHLTSQLFPSAGTPAVNEAMELLLDARMRAFLVRRVLPHSRNEPAGRVAGRRLQLWRKYWLIDRAWRRFAFVAYHAWQTILGLAAELRLRRAGIFLPPRSSTR